ncbi:MAG TPA: LytTR family DNA-binding domain-containing protein [Parapedobacter sp.]|uniref:LytR/AlgR family response regulator transcription factor n=1 Tax=Parapedobacter sp. TaxID=1958893 RepID=UPI002CAEED93|nr:LytTR family DNA-binding domain-containing protein [Parapedobacter sp.]HWK57430.1 LytTR family DNA-binding domain-containing protein [Parapedobacter sp.]
MFKIALIDDEQHCVKSLLLHINHLFPDFEVVFHSTKPREAIKTLQETAVDLLFLDVEMPGISGFELLDQFEQPPFDVIFTTAYSQYAIQAFKVRAVDYLLKPVDERELMDAVMGWRERRELEQDNNQISALLDSLKKDGLLGNKVAVPILDGFEFIDVKTILYCQSENNYTNIHFESGKTLLISKTLKEFEKVMEKFLFIRTHQSYLINPQYMRKYVRNDGGYIVLVNGKEIPVSASRKRLIVGLFEAIKR